MKTIAVHSHKGGVGKTTVALLIAKHAATSGQKVCVVDFDFIGSGMADLFALKKVPDSYLEEYFLCANPHGFNLQQLLGNYTDEDMGQQEFSVILNLRKGPLDKKDAKTLDYMMGLVADEPHYRAIQMETTILLDKLKEHGVELTIVDCHPGLGLVSKTIRPMTSLNVYVTTPNRADCFGLLKTMNLNKLDSSRSFLIVNRAEPTLIDLNSFKFLMELDALVGTEVKFLFQYLKYVGQNEEQFAIIPESELLLGVFYLGGSGYLPRILQEQAEFSFCSKALSLVDGRRRKR